MNIENYFVSDDFFNALMPLYGRVDDLKVISVLEFVIGNALKFASYNNFSIDGVDKFVRTLVKKISINPNDKVNYANDGLLKFVEELSFSLLLENLNFSLKQLKNNDVQDFLCRYIINNIRLNKYIYHSFNSIAFDSIKKHGVNPNVKLTEQGDIDKINAIFVKHGINMIFGWQKLDCEGKVSFSLSPSVSFSYASYSPEWFSQFCGGSNAFSRLKDRCEYSFAKRDYEGSKGNLYSLMKENNFSVDEIQMVLDFFDENWNKYANGKGMLAVIVDKDSSYDADFLYKRYRSLGYSVEEIFGFSCCDKEIDLSTKETLDVSDAKFIFLPSYGSLFNKLANSNIKGKLQFLRGTKIYFDKDSSGKKILVSANGEDEVNLVKDILSDEDVFNYILNDESSEFDRWIPYFSFSIINKDENIVKISQKKSMYFGYVSELKRNNVELMKKCLNCDNISKDFIFSVGENVLDDIEFISLLIIKLSDDDFDFQYPSSCSIEGSRMGYGKILGRNVQTNPNFWKLLNSKIKISNKKNGLNIPLFNENREIVYARRYFDGLNVKN